MKTLLIFSISFALTLALEKWVTDVPNEIRIRKQQYVKIPQSKWRGGKI